MNRDGSRGDQRSQRPGPRAVRTLSATSTRPTRTSLISKPSCGRFACVRDESPVTVQRPDTSPRVCDAISRSQSFAGTTQPVRTRNRELLRRARCVESMKRYRAPTLCKTPQGSDHATAQDERREDISSGPVRLARSAGVIGRVHAQAVHQCERLCEQPGADAASGI